MKAAEGRARQAGLMPNPEAGLNRRTSPVRDPMVALARPKPRPPSASAWSWAASAAPAPPPPTPRSTPPASASSSPRPISPRKYASATPRPWPPRTGLVLARETATRAEGLSEVAGTLVEAGREPPLRALRAEAASREAAAAVIGAEAEALAARRALVTLWGDAGEAIELVRAPEAAAPVQATIDPGETLDVRQARADLQTARAVIDRERAVGRPDLTVQAGVRRFEQTGDSAMIVGFTAPIPISNRNQGSVAAARADATAAEAREAPGPGPVGSGSARRRGLASRCQRQARSPRQQDRPSRPGDGGRPRQKRLRGRQVLAARRSLDAQGALTTARTELIAARLERAQGAGRAQNAPPPNRKAHHEVHR
ncbi:TolC family protein [Caulobacter segnis]